MNYRRGISPVSANDWINATQLERSARKRQAMGGPQLTGLLRFVALLDIVEGPPAR